MEGGESPPLFNQFCRELAGLRETPAVTPDGHRIRLSANIGLAEEIPSALAQGAEGIWLVRTELFYRAHNGAPTEAISPHRQPGGIGDAISPPRAPSAGPHAARGVDVHRMTDGAGVCSRSMEILQPQAAGRAGSTMAGPVG